MTCLKEGPPSGEGGPIAVSSFGGVDSQSNKENPAPAQAPIERNPLAVAAMQRELNLEFLRECAGRIRIHAELIQTFAEIGDISGACYALKRLFAHAKAAHPIFVELRDALAPAEERAP